MRASCQPPYTVSRACEKEVVTSNERLARPSKLVSLGSNVVEVSSLEIAPPQAGKNLSRGIVRKDVAVSLK